MDIQKAISLVLDLAEQSVLEKAHAEAIGQGEYEKQREAVDMVREVLKDTGGKYKIRLDMTESELEDLRRGKEFNWTYDTECGRAKIDVNLFNVDLNPEEE